MFPDRDQFTVGVAPYGVAPRGEVAVGAVEGAQGGEFVLPGFVAGFPHHPGLVEESLAVGIEFARAVHAPLLVNPPPQRECLGGAGFGLGVVRDGVQAGDAVLFPPAEQGLVSLEPDQ